MVIKLANKKVIILALICSILIISNVLAQDLVVGKTTTLGKITVSPTATPTPTTIPTPSINKATISIKDSLSAISIKSISSTGTISKTAIDIKSLPTDTASVSSIEITKGTITKTKILQILPQAQVQISDDTETVMQFVDSSHGEIYYGYQIDQLHPWSQLYKVNGEQTTKADFASRTVTIIPTDHTKVQEIIDSDEIPAWEDWS